MGGALTCCLGRRGADYPGYEYRDPAVGLPPELNQVVKAVVVLCVLIVQSPRFISILKGMRGHDKT